MNITEIVSAKPMPSRFRESSAWRVTFKTDDGRLFELAEVMQENKPQLHHIQREATAHPAHFWESWAKEIGHAE